MTAEMAEVWCSKCELAAVIAIRLKNGELVARCSQHAWLLIAPRGKGRKR
jgi:hypothetical protein